MKHKLKINNNKDSIFKLYLKHIIALALVFICFAISIVFILKNIMTPFYYEALQRSVYEEFKNYELIFTTSILNNNVLEVKEKLKSKDFINIAKSKWLKNFTLDEYQKYGIFNVCPNGVISNQYGNVCYNDSRLLIELPLKSADNTLAHLYVDVLPDISSWKPYRVIALGMYVVVLIIVAFTVFLILRFYRKFAIPIRKAIIAFEEKKHKLDFQSIKDKFPIEELYKLTSELEKYHKIIVLNEGLAAIGQSAAMLAHDVRKPFSLVKSVIDEFEMYKDNKELLDGVRKTTHQSIRQVERMINDIMDFSREVKLETNPTSIVTVLDFSIREIAQQFSKEDISIRFDLRHAHKPMLDEERMVRVISNILLNALEAIVNIGKKSTGTVWFRTMDITKEKKGFVRLTIGNSGPAIPEEDMDKLFESFFTKGKRKGTGIGLASAQKIVNLHGGEIRGRNCDNNEGVEFEIDLPISNEIDDKDQSELPKELKEAAFLRLRMDEDEIEERTTRLKESGKKFKVLLLEDEALYRASVRNTIKSNSNLDRIITLYDSHTVEEALDLLKSQKISHAIVDIDLADVKNGFDFLKDAVKIYPDLKCMVHTNRCIDEDRKRAFALGARAFVPKPLNIEHLIGFLYDSQYQMIEDKQRLNTCAKNLTETRILLVNDEKYILEVMENIVCKALEMRGLCYRIFTATNYDGTLEILEQNEIDLLLCDLNLCERNDGLDIIRVARNLNETAKLYLVTGTPKSTIEARLKESGATGFLTLPLKAEHIVGLL